jgi:hypothetical protein
MRAENTLKKGLFLRSFIGFREVAMQLLTKWVKAHILNRLKHIYQINHKYQYYGGS